MNIFSSREPGTLPDDAEDLAYPPSGGPAKMWMAGVVCASVPVIYGAICLHRGYTTLFGRYGRDESVHGWPGIALAIAYMGMGIFAHFHYFWGLSGSLWRFSGAGKSCTLVVMLPSLLYALWHVFVDNMM